MCLLAVLLILTVQKKLCWLSANGTTSTHPTTNRETEKKRESSSLVNKEQAASSIVVDETLRFGMLQVASRVHAMEGA